MATRITRHMRPDDVPAQRANVAGSRIRHQLPVYSAITDSHRIFDAREAYYQPSARMRSEGYGSWFVCLSVKSHLTSGASDRPEIDVTYSTGNEGQKHCGVFSETGDPALPPSNGHTYRRPFFTHVRYNYEHAHTGSYAHTCARAHAPRVCTLILGY